MEVILARCSLKTQSPETWEKGVLLNAFDHYRDLGLLIARLGFGLGFTWHHGFPKIMSGMDGMADRG